jgi:hypothetical protein
MKQKWTVLLNVISMLKLKGLATFNLPILFASESTFALIGETKLPFRELFLIILMCNFHKRMFSVGRKCWDILTDNGLHSNCVPISLAVKNRTKCSTDKISSESIRSSTSCSVVLSFCLFLFYPSFKKKVIIVLRLFEKKRVRLRTWNRNKRLIVSSPQLYSFLAASCA